MTNLGSTNTPAAAQSLELPNGYAPALEESSGDLVINDTNGNTVLRWDDTNAKWQLAATLDADGNDVTNVGALGTDEVTTKKLATDQGTVWSQASNDLLQTSPALTTANEASTVSSTSTENICRMSGFFDMASVPDAATVYGRMGGRTGGTIDQDVTIFPTAANGQDGSTSTINGLRLTIQQGNTYDPFDTSWVEITDTEFQDNFIVGSRIRGSLETQTNGDSAEPILKTSVGISFAWRIDS
jgi:hypothetical protein